jgi:hypothetical protein
VKAEKMGEQVKQTPKFDTERRFDPALLQALAGLDTDASMAVVQRTRRSVMAAANEMRSRRDHSRKQLGLILLAVATMVTLLTPAIWVVADDIFEGEHFQDPPTLAVSLVLTFISTILAALIVNWRTRQSRGREEL